MMSVWQGFDNGLPSADMSPNFLAPTNSDQLQWPLWGLHYLSGKTQGKPPDLPVVQELAQLLERWKLTVTSDQREEIWRRMLSIHADQVFSIGTVNGAMQPVVRSSKLRNVPEEGLYGFEPTSYLGVYMPDTFWYQEL
jgi:peptide/nickel transport system substrate-binding protein